MGITCRLWNDEAGIILSAEAVVVGTVAVVGLTAGMSVVATSVNEELKDFGYAIRSLDQSYSIPAQQSCCAQTAGSSFTQEPVKESLKELDTVFRKAERAEKEQAERLEQQMKEQKKDSTRKKNRKGKDSDKQESAEDKENSDVPNKRRSERQI